MVSVGNLVLAFMAVLDIVDDKLVLAKQMGGIVIDNSTSSQDVDVDVCMYFTRLL
jgi:hypothetical protein